ncbi:MAG: CPBP family glutamic-type intramembrane protease [Ktedonobacterales bacterium]
MQALHTTVAGRVWIGRAIWIAELCLIPLSNNLVALIQWRTSLDLYPVLAALLYSYIGFRHLQVLPFGFRWSWRSVAIGGTAGAALALPVLAFFAHPILIGSIAYQPITSLSVNGLIHRLLVDLPVLTALVEELTFRHWLYFEVTSLPRTLLFNSLLFTVWHGVAGFVAVYSTGIGRGGGMLLAAYAGSLLAVFVGGVVFAFVRHKTGSFVYSALTHWLSDAVIVLAMWGTAHVGR